MTADEVVQAVERGPVGWGWFKYVRVASEFRFADVLAGMGWMVQHKDMVSPDEEVMSAGLVEVAREYFLFRGKGSGSIGVVWDEADIELLEKALGRPHRRGE